MADFGWLSLGWLNSLSKAPATPAAGRPARPQRDVTSPVLVLVTGLPGTGKSTLASALATELNSAVIGHDWVMAGLKHHPALWSAMGALDRVGSRSVGWSVMWNIARAQLREGRSIVLDGVARSPEIRKTRSVGGESRSATVVVLCEIVDPDVHRGRLEGRSRQIPGWGELSWHEVERTRERWERPLDVEVVVDSSVGVEASLAHVRHAIHVARRTDSDGATR